MRCRLLIAFVFAAMVLAALDGCKGGGQIDPPTPEPEPLLIDTTIVVPATGATNCFSFFSYSGWEASLASGTKWCHVTPAEGGSGGVTIEVKVDANDEFSVRQTRIDIKNSTTTGVINVIQQQIDVLDVTTDDICDFGPQGGTFAVNVGYNIDYTVTCSKDWVRQSQTKALQRATLMFEVDKNNSGGDRTCEVTFDGSGFHHTITVSQIAAYISLSISDVALGADVSSFPVIVESNVSYTATVPEAEWLTINGNPAAGTDGMETSTMVNLAIEENEGWFLREGDVVFGNPDYNLSGTLHILQKSVDIMYASLPLFEFGPAGGTFEFDIDTSKEYAFSTGDADWVTVTVPGDNPARRVITVAKSLEGEARTASLLITRGNARKTLDFSQAGTAPEISDRELSFATAGGSHILSVTGAVEYTLVMPDGAPWCTVTQAESGDYVVNIAANDTESPRECRLIFKNEEYGVNETVCVSQAQKDAFAVSPTEFSFGPEGGRVQVGVHSNIEYAYTVDFPEWIVETRAATDADKVFMVALNATGAPRRGRVIFTAGGAETVVNIDQGAAFITASDHDFTLDDQPASRSFSVESNISFETKVEGGGSWLSLDAIADGKVSFSMEENDDWGNRTAKIIVYNSDYAASDTITVFQGAKYYLDIAQTGFDLPPQGGEVALEVVSNKEYDYHIDGSPDWILETSPLVFSIDANKGDQAREVQIVFEQSGKSKSVSISQDAPVLAVSPASFAFTAIGGEATFSVSGNIDYEMISPSADWVQCNAAGVSSYTVAVASNSVPEARNCAIEVLSSEYGRSATIEISQAAKGIFELLTDSFEFGPEGGDIAVGVNTNVDYSATSGSDWITGEGLSFAVARNTSGEERRGLIEYAAEGYTYTVTVTQRAARVDVDKEQLDLPVDGGVRNFTVSANVAYEVIPPESDWVSVTAAGDGTYEVEVTLNGGEQARECTVQIVSADYGITRDVQVLQDRSDFFELSTTEFDFGPEGGEAEVVLRTNVDYTCTIGGDWVTDGGDQTFVVGKNATGHDRECSIEFEAAGETYAVAIRQTAAWLTIDTETVSIDQAGGSFVVTTQGNVPYEVVLPQITWVTETEASAEDEHAFKVSAYNNYGSRNCTIKFVAEDYGLSRSLRVSQKGLPDPFSVENKEYFIGPCGGELEVKHSECSDVDVSIHGFSWIRENVQKRTSTRVMFSVDTMFTESTREAVVSIVGNGKSNTIYIFQNAPLLSVRESSKYVKAEGGDVSIGVTTNMPVNVYCDDGWVSGQLNEEGNQVVFTVAPNDTGLERSTVVEVGVRELNCTKKVTFTQEPNDWISLTPESCTVPAAGDVVYVTVEANVLVACNTYDTWVSCERTADDNVYRVTVQANTSVFSRDAEVRFSGGKASAKFTVTQDGYRNPNYYYSEDFSRHGKITNLQHATVGAGIQLILMGDAFSDRLIENGTYAAAINNAVEDFFAIEPFASFRNMFEISMIDVVSLNEVIAEDTNTALGTYFQSGTVVNGEEISVYQLAQTVSGFRKGNVLIIVIMNSNKYGGTTYLKYPTDTYGDYGVGNAIAYVPLCTSREQFASVLQHEAGGHGFGKLQDEYCYSSNGAIPAQLAADMRDKQSRGFYKNIDFTSDPSKVRWSVFLQDERYQYDGLGVFEGACGYSSGVFRPTESSMMYHNEGPFNAPSREAIYYRLHKLAYGSNWVYDREAFVEYDAINRRTSPRASQSGAKGASSFDHELPALPPPVLEKQ